MSKPECYEALILGSGEGGKFLAWHLARSGWKTAVVERKWIGGSCPNINCLPSKNEIWSAKVADLVHHAARFGMVTGPTGDRHEGACGKRKREMVEGLVAMHLEKYRGQRRRVGHGFRAFSHRTENGRGASERRRTPGAGRRPGFSSTWGPMPPSPQSRGCRKAEPSTNIELLEDSTGCPSISS